MRYLLLSLLLCVGCGTAPNEPDTSVFLDGDVQDFSVRDQDLLDGGMEDGTVPIDMGRGTAGLGDPCTNDLDCSSAHFYCRPGFATCELRRIGVSCDRYITGNNTEELCSVTPMVGTSHTVRPLDTNDIPEHWVWCLDQTEQMCGDQSCGFRCGRNPPLGFGVPLAPTCFTDTDCVGHFENPDCYFNTCRTLNCHTPLQTTGCQAGEICSGLNLCVPNN